MPTYEQCAISIVMHVPGLEPGIDPCIQADVRVIIARGAPGCPARDRA